jgi:glutamine amidotransferase
MSADSPVVIVDYEAGNILSVARVFDHIGAKITITNNADEIASAERIVLPGVGAFGKAMAELNRQGLVDSIQRFAKSGRPFLGICLGMQMMLESSEEFGRHDGLGLIKGHVNAIPSTAVDGTPHKIPHIGWNNLLPAPNAHWKDTILADQESSLSLYFVHSFMAEPKASEDRLANTDYNGHKLCAAIRKDNLYGFQCHPEKSGEAGINILRNFLAL